MEEMKTLGYDWEYGHEELIIKVDSYMAGNRLYIGLFRMEEESLENFSDLTVNVPFEPAKVNEAYISDFLSEEHLEFIKKHELGKILPEVGHSGFVKYAKVAFNLERLAEFDREGIEDYRKLHGIS